MSSLYAKRGRDGRGGRAGSRVRRLGSPEKGQALRAGLEYFHKELQWLPGVVCLNVEEGYTVEDVLRVAAAMEANPGKIIVAARAANRGLGLKERLVKACAGKFFSALHGRAVKDPWAGLRAVPSAAVPSLLDLNGDGRRFAFNILLNMQHKGIKAVSVPVSALYDAGGEQERGERSKDVFRILVLPLKFVAASCMATACDYSAFGITYYIIHLPGLTRRPRAASPARHRGLFHQQEHRFQAEKQIMARESRSGNAICRAGPGKLRRLHRPYELFHQLPSFLHHRGEIHFGYSAYTPPIILSSGNSFSAARPNRRIDTYM